MRHQAVALALCLFAPAAPLACAAASPSAQPAAPVAAPQAQRVSDGGATLLGAPSPRVDAGWALGDADAVGAGSDPIRVYLELAPGGDAHPGQLLVVAPALKLREPVQEVPEPYACVVAQPGDSQKNASLRHSDLRPQLEASCEPGARTRPYVEAGDGAIIVYANGRAQQAIQLPPDAEVILDHDLRTPSVTTECGDVSGPVVDVVLEQTALRTDYPGGRGLRLRVPALGITQDLFSDARSRAAANTAAVYTRVARPQGLALHVVGSLDGQSAEVWLQVEGGLLLIKTYWIDKVTGGRERFGAIKLPCGSTPRWKTSFVANPNPMNLPPCFRACEAAHSSCNTSCYQRHADARGELAGPGEACVEACREASAPCWRRCEPRN